VNKWINFAIRDERLTSLVGATVLELTNFAACVMDMVWALHNCIRSKEVLVSLERHSFGVEVVACVPRKLFLLNSAGAQRKERGRCEVYHNVTRIRPKC